MEGLDLPTLTLEILKMKSFKQHVQDRTKSAEANREILTESIIFSCRKVCPNILYKLTQVKAAIESVPSMGWDHSCDH